jgi:thioredoxin 1
MQKPESAAFEIDQEGRRDASHRIALIKSGVCSTRSCLNQELRRRAHHYFLGQVQSDGQTMHANRRRVQKYAGATGALVLLDFYADWCAPCRIVSPLLATLAHEFEEKTRLVKVNVDTNSDMVNKYGVYSIPTIVFIRNGREIDRIIGAKTKDKYRNAIIKSLQKKRTVKS